MLEVVVMMIIPTIYDGDNDGSGVGVHFTKLGDSDGSGVGDDCVYVGDDDI